MTQPISKTMIGFKISRKLFVMNKNSKKKKETTKTSGSVSSSSTFYTVRNSQNGCSETQKEAFQVLDAHPGFSFFILNDVYYNLTL